MEAKTQLLIPKKDENNENRNHDNNLCSREEHFHVLAVDDSVIERKMLEKLLTISSYHVTCVESGDKALEYLGLVDCHSPDDQVHVVDPYHDDGHHVVEGHDDHVSMVGSSSLQLPDDAHHQHGGQVTRVNLIMTDYSMPGMSGYDLLKRVKGSSWRDVPVVVMSSENVPSRIHMCLEEGAEEFLLKPVRLADLKKLQPRIFKATPSTSCESGDNTCDFIAATDSKFSKEDMIIIGDHEDYSSNSSEGDTKLNNEMEHFVKSSKIDQLVM